MSSIFSLLAGMAPAESLHRATEQRMQLQCRSCMQGYVVPKAAQQGCAKGGVKGRCETCARPKQLVHSREVLKTSCPALRSPRGIDRVACQGEGAAGQTGAKRQ